MNLLYRTLENATCIFSFYKTFSYVYNIEDRYTRMCVFLEIYSTC